MAPNILLHVFNSFFIVPSASRIAYCKQENKSSLPSLPSLLNFSETHAFIIWPFLGNLVLETTPVVVAFWKDTLSDIFFK